jgi:multidrug efflux pump subunit AcrA (membrane-fusion protein)
MKKIFSILTLLALLISCWKSTENIIEEAKKTDFFVETTLGSDFTNTISLEKVWQVKSSQDISLSSNANGRVSSVYVRAWDSVYVWETLAVLEDNIWSYGINLQKSSNSVERAQINYESTELSLDKNIFDAELQLGTLERNLVALKSDSQQNLLLAEDTFKNSQYDGLDSRSALTIEGLDNSIEKSKLDYQIKISSNTQSINWYKTTLKKEFSWLLTSLIDIQEFADSLLWFTDNNKGDNDDFEDFLWVQDKGQKRSSELALQALIKFSEMEKFESIRATVKKTDISEWEMIDVIDFIDGWYDKILDVLNKLELTINNSIQSEWSLGEAEINWFIASINGFQASVQGAYGVYISQSTSIKSFLITYKDSQASTFKSIELQEKDREIQFKTLSSWQLTAWAGYERTLISTSDNISNLKSQIESAKKSLDNSIKNKDITLRSLNNAISEAQIWYSSSAKEYGKLTITSPITGTIWEVFIDKWQEIFSWKAAFDIVSNGTPEVEVSLSKWEKDIISVDTPVKVMIWGEAFTGSIYAISGVADDNLNYKTIITFDSGTNIIGNIVTVHFSIPTDKMLVPINVITTQWEEIGTLKTLSGSSFEDVRIRMWEVFWDYAEVISCAKNCSDLQIIISDISNFDENKFTVLEK